MTYYGAPEESAGTTLGLNRKTDEPDDPLAVRIPAQFVQRVAYFPLRLYHTLAMEFG